MSKTFFTADTHFGSERTLTLSRRPFDNVEEMNRNLIEQYNKLVSDDDTVYHLGDFGDYSFTKQLSGKIVLVWGNYELREFINEFSVRSLFRIPDTFSDEDVWSYITTHEHDSEKMEALSNYEREFNNKLYEKGNFHNIINFDGTGLNIQKGTKNLWVRLCHEPTQCLVDVDLNSEMNLFGHIHGRQLVKQYGLDVGVDGHHFRPIDVDTVFFYQEAILKHYDVNVFL